MNLVFASHSGRCTEIFRALSVDERDRLTQSASSQDLPDLQEWLAMVAQARFWVACDCRPTGSPPVSAVTRDAEGIYRLARIVDRPPHDANCQLRGLPTLADVIGGTPAPVSLVRNLLELAGTNRLVMAGNETSVGHAQAERIARAARRMRLDGGQVKLGKYLATGTDQIPQLARKLAGNSDPWRATPTGIALLLANRLAEGVVRLPTAKVLEIGNCPVFALGEPNASGPALVALGIQAGKAGRPRYVSATVQPVLSTDNLFPVATNIERITARCLLQAQRNWRDTERVVFRVMKPLHADVRARGTAFLISPMGVSGQFDTAWQVVTVDTRGLELDLPWHPPTQHGSALHHDVRGGYQHEFLEALAARLVPLRERAGGRGGGLTPHPEASAVTEAKIPVVVESSP